jgi:type II secretory pathway component PulF
MVDNHYRRGKERRVSSQHLSPQDRNNVVWFCRRLAAALQGQDSLLVAVATIATGATPAQRTYLTRLRRQVEAGRHLSDAVFPDSQPAYLWGPLRGGENRNDLAPALAGIAERLEAEAAYPQSPSRLQAYAIALARLGFTLSLGVPILAAMEGAAESVPDAEVTEVLFAVRAAVGEGVGLGDALARLAPDLPPLTADMIRDGEEEGRLDFALSVVSDYLFDQAGEPASTSPSQEVSHG